MNKQSIKNGFTFFEIIIATLIAMSVLGGFSAFLVYYIKSYQFSFDENMAITQGENTVRQITNEIREARAANNGSYPLVTTTDSELVFYGDIDNDNDAERVRYFLNGTNLNKGIIEPTGFPAEYLVENESVRTITEYIRNGIDPVFYYYNADWPGDVINNPLAVESRLLGTRLITVFLRVNVNEELNTQDFEISSSTQLRNLKDNL